MSPEAIQTPQLVDTRSDLYAVGAVGYFLLTGQPVFNAQSLVELCRQHVAQVPDSPSLRLARAVSPALENAILACLEKNPAKRPQTARDLALRIAKAPTANGWSLDEADAWWGRHERGLATPSPSSSPQNDSHESTQSFAGVDSGNSATSDNLNLTTSKSGDSPFAKTNISNLEDK